MSSKVFESDDSVSEGDFDNSFDGEGEDSFWSDGDEGGKHDNKKPQEVEKKPVSKKLLDLKEKFGLDDLKPLESTSNSLPKPRAVTTVASKLLRVVAEPEVVVYQDPRKLKKAKVNKNQIGNKTSADASTPDMSLEQARHEVRKFGIAGMGKANREEARAALAISLGAIPPKRKAINYKDLQAQQKKAKEEEKRQKEMDEIFKSRVKTMTKSKKKRDKNKVAGFDSQFGKFSGGVQKLSRSNIQRIKSKR